MTFTWTPHEIDKEIFCCETGNPNIKAGVSYFKDSWLAWITIEVTNAHTGIRTWHACKEEAMALIEQRLDDLLPPES